MKKKLFAAGISKIEIERAANKISVNIYTAKPGIVIGKGGTGLDVIKADLKKLTEELGHMQIDSILLEGGATLAAAAFESGIIDKVQMYIAPMIIGGNAARTPVGGNGIEHLTDAWQLTGITARNIGNDICITGYIRQEA